MKDIITLGEVLIDLTQTGRDEGNVCRFAAFPGGAPANVAACAARLGASAGFIGKIGRDSFGQELCSTLEREKVDTTYLRETADFPTTLAIVHVEDDGERSFTFYRQPGADTQLTAEEALEWSRREDFPRVLHFGSLSLTDEPAREATLAAVREARSSGVLVSYDPNYRPALWPNEETGVSWMKVPLAEVDIIKVSEEEMEMMSGTADLEKGSLWFAEQGIRLVLVTLGERGVYYRHGSGWGRIPTVPTVVADTNGAGDTFLGAVLTCLCRWLGEDPGRTLDRLPEGELKEFLAFGNRAAAKTCSRSGAIPAMPVLEEMNEE